MGDTAIGSLAGNVASRASSSRCSSVSVSFMRQALRARVLRVLRRASGALLMKHGLRILGTEAQSRAAIVRGMKIGAAFFATILSALVAVLAVGAMVEVGADILVAVITTITPP